MDLEQKLVVDNNNSVLRTELNKKKMSRSGYMSQNDDVELSSRTVDDSEAAPAETKEVFSNLKIFSRSL